MKSTLYVKCPKCGETALVREMQGKYICAVCGFDYTTLKDEPQKLDEMLVTNLKLGPMGQVMALTMNELITLKTVKESNEYVKELAQKNGIKFPDYKKGFFSRLFGKGKN